MGLAQLKSGATNSICVSSVGGRGPSPGANFLSSSPKPSNCISRKPGQKRNCLDSMFKLWVAT